MYATVSKHGHFTSADLTREPDGKEVIWFHGDGSLCVTLEEARWMLESLKSLLAGRDVAPPAPPRAAEEPLYKNVVVRKVDAPSSLRYEENF